MRCKNCGAKNADTAIECENCGAFLKKETIDAGPAYTPRGNGPKKRPSQTAIVISVVTGIIILALIATCVVLAVRKNQDRTELSSSTGDTVTASQTKGETAGRSTTSPRTEPSATQPEVTVPPTEPPTEEPVTVPATEPPSTSDPSPTQQEELRPTAPEEE